MPEQNTDKPTHAQEVATDENQADENGAEKLAIEGIESVDAHDRHLTIGGVLMLDIRASEMIDLEFCYHWTESEEDGTEYNMIVIPRAHARVPEWAQPVKPGELIGPPESGSQVSWSDMAQVLMSRAIKDSEPRAWEGPWVTLDHGMLPFLIEVDEDARLYGWLELSVDGVEGELTLHRFAYNRAPNQPIRAGEGEKSV